MMQMFFPFELVTLNIEETALLVLKCSFHLHPLSIICHPCMRCTQVRHQNPWFLVSFFPADTHECYEFMLFPQNNLTIPFFSIFFNKMLALQPIMKAPAVLFAEPFLLLNDNCFCRCSQLSNSKEACIWKVDFSRYRLLGVC